MIDQSYAQKPFWLMIVRNYTIQYIGDYHHRDPILTSQYKKGTTFRVLNAAQLIIFIVGYIIYHHCIHSYIYIITIFPYFLTVMALDSHKWN